MSSDARGKRASRRGCTPARRGVAASELIAVGVMFTIAGAVVVPAARDLRSRAREASCVTNLALFGQGMLLYTNDNLDYFPGLNTSGVPLRVKQNVLGTDPNVLHDPTMPVQATDWLTPVALYFADGPLPANRAARWHHLWTRYRCPEQGASAVPYTGGGAPPDAADFASYHWPAPSYLAPIWFQYWGQSNRPILAYREHPDPNIRIPIYASAAPTSWEVLVQTYRPRLDLIANPQEKVFVADGTRYMPSASQPIDFEVNPVPTLATGVPAYGAFCSGGGWYSGDNSYGVRIGTLNWSLDPVVSGSASAGFNLGVSYRHGRGDAAAEQVSYGDGSALNNSGSINMVFFDGHVDTQVDYKSRIIGQWYPSGGAVQQSRNMTTEPLGSVIP